jgi:hypothetical protein
VIAAMKHHHRLSLWQIFAAPLAVAVISSLGLVAALVGDGVWDGVSWAALAIPVFLYFLFLWWRKPR